ncbi:DUF3078 domain-containing protein [Flammeovirga kamogawensis]|uniref:DUF3078 domain-containing protein n=1 Tax=Flammeovirga kamogawensis TaxID=373891 RepID=A0ABX8GXH3_9BACT|nr:DUF3078 domain-containing protein [Flammeovirga kamogawensis]MBB6460540.1 hypothetical protein [Flammeovirga kamogawensis]QWG07902.1 DUF3078 domain-containing protein [Flammeovirga kamogawensis]TRX69708.1 DUF3078 domain-containing protein [Flammeovirga kamogawensis]
MRFIISTLGALLLIFSTTKVAQAQDSTNVTPPKIWKHEGKFGLNFSNVGLVNWAGGGESSYSFGGIQTYKGIRETDKAITRVYTDLAYGLINQSNSTFPMKKTDDRLNLGADYSYKLNKKFLITASGDFRTQFDKGYEYKTEEINGVKIETENQISAFFAPAYLNLNIGLTYNPKEYCFLTLSPIANRMTFVTDTVFSEKYGLKPQETFRDQSGVNIKFGFDKEVVKNVTLKTTYNMFAEYSRMDEWIVNWDFLIDMKVNKYLSCNFSTQLIYDPDVTVDRNDGTTGQAVQFKHALNIGLVYSFATFDK